MLKLLMKDGNVVVRNGRPVYVEDDGTEVEFDAPGSIASIARLKTEAKGHRENAERLQATVDTFKDLEPEAARKALQTVKDLGDNQLIKAGKLDEVKSELNKAWEEKLKVEKARGDKAEGELVTEKIGGAFSRSKYIAEHLAIPADITQATFGKHFKLEDGRVVAYDGTGTRIHSKANPGEVADFDEALSLIVGGYANRDAILKAKTGSGGGANRGGGAGGGNNSNTRTRSEVDAMSPVDKAKFFREGGKAVDAAA